MSITVRSIERGTVQRLEGTTARFALGADRRPRGSILRHGTEVLPTAEDADTGAVRVGRQVRCGVFAVEGSICGDGVCGVL